MIQSDQQLRASNEKGKINFKVAKLNGISGIAKLGSEAERVVVVGSISFTKSITVA